MNWSRSWPRWVGGSVLGGLLLAGGAFGEGDLRLLPRDLGKFTIEAPVKRVVSGTSTQPTTSVATDRANPKIAPGKVLWHADFAEACAASKKSGRPVLLFQMMGKLDERFC